MTLMHTDPFREFDRLTRQMRIPVTGQAKPRRIAIGSAGSERQAINA